MAYAQLGRDEMGALPHAHLDDWYLRLIADAGLDVMHGRTVDLEALGDTPDHGAGA